MTQIEKRQQRGALVDAMRALADKAKAESRAMSADELAEFDRLDDAQARLGETINRESRTQGRTLAGRDGLGALEAELRQPLGEPLKPHPMYTDARPPRAGELRLLAPSESLRDHLPAELPDGLRPGDLRIGRVVRAIAVGSWRGAEAEARAMGTSPLSAGGALVPGSLSADIIDAARARSVVFKAGAKTVLMPSASLDFARVANDPVSQWKGENAAATESNVGLERVVLRSRTLMGLTRASLELIEDAPNAGSVIENALASSLALELDRACLRGGETSGAIEPTGVRFYDGVQLMTGIGALTLDHFANAAGLILGQNGPDPGALTAILAPRDWSRIDKLKDGDGMPLTGPPSWQAMQKLVSNQVPATLGVGSNESESFVGDFSRMVVGIRSELSLEVSREAADTFGRHQILVRAVLRGDVILEHERHFVCLTGILPSS
jgi:HK97 family phage major capsid protein